MFNRICQLREPLQAAIALLNNPVETLTDIEWTVLREVSRILKPFQVVTTEMSSDKYLTVSKVIMLAHGLSSGPGTGGSGGSMNRGPGPPSSWGPRVVGPQKNFRQDC